MLWHNLAAIPFFFIDLAVIRDPEYTKYTHTAHIKKWLWRICFVKLICILFLAFNEASTRSHKFIHIDKVSFFLRIEEEAYEQRKKKTNDQNP